MLPGMGAKKHANLSPAATNAVAEISAATIARDSGPRWNLGCCVVDPDEMLYYSIPKGIRIRSWPLGLLNYSLILLVIIASVVNLVVTEGYLKKVPVLRTAVSARVSAPSKYITVEDLNYCCECSSETGLPVNASCLEETFIDFDTNETLVGFHKTCCFNLDPEAKRTSEMVDTTISIPTLISFGTSSTQCKFPTGGEKCAWHDVVTTPDMFVQDVEHYTIGIQHSISNPDHPEVDEARAGTLEKMEGVLINKRGEIIRSWPDESAADDDREKSQGRLRMYDIVTLNDLLMAADLLPYDSTQRIASLTTQKELLDEKKWLPVYPYKSWYQIQQTALLGVSIESSAGYAVSSCKDEAALKAKIQKELDMTIPALDKSRPAQLEADTKRTMAGLQRLQGQGVADLKGISEEELLKIAEKKEYRSSSGLDSITRMSGVYDESLRSAGVQLVVFIKYTQTKSGDMQALWDAMEGVAPAQTYQYEVVPQLSLQFKKYVELANSGSNQYNIEYMNVRGAYISLSLACHPPTLVPSPPASNFHAPSPGVKLMFVQSGFTGKWDWTDIAVSMVFAQGMLALAAMFVFNLARYGMRNSLFYDNAMFERTMDFSNFRNATDCQQAIAEAMIPSASSFELAVQIKTLENVLLKFNNLTEEQKGMLTRPHPLTALAESYGVAVDDGAEDTALLQRDGSTLATGHLNKSEIHNAQFAPRAASMHDSL
jgi:hypothetical protein